MAENLSLGIDASAAQQGARQFADAIDKILSASRNATQGIESVNKSSATLASSLKASQTSIAGLSNNLSNVAKQFTDASDKIAAASRKSSKDIESLGKSASNLSTGLGAGAAAIGGFIGAVAGTIGADVLGFITQLPGKVLEVASSYDRLDSRIALVTRGIADLKQVHADLLGVAQRTSTTFEATGGFFARVASQSKELGLAYEDIIHLTETLQLAFKASGANAAETSSVMLQLGQAFGSGKFQGEEFKAVAEGAPIILDAMSRAFGASREELMKWSEEGILTPKAAIAALLSEMGNMQEQAGGMADTVGDASTRMQNAWNELVKQFDATTGASSTAISALDSITSWMESPSGTAAVDALSSAVNDLIEALGNIGAAVAPAISALNDIGNTVVAVRDSIASVVSAVGGALAEAAKARSEANKALGKEALGQTGREQNAALDKMLKNVPIAGVAPAERVRTLEFGISGPAGLEVSQEQSAAASQYKKSPEQLRSLLGPGKTKKTRKGAKDPAIAGRERAQAALDELQTDLDLFDRERDQAIESAIDRLGKYATDAQKKVAGDIAGALFDKKQLKVQQQALDSLSESLRLFGDERAQAQEAAAKSLGEFASPAQVQQAKDMAGQLFDLKQLEQQKKALDSLRESVQLFGDERAQAEAQATRSLGDFASSEQIDQAKELANSLIDLREGEKVFDDTRTKAEKYAEEVARLSDLQERGAISADTFNRAVAALEPPTFSDKMLQFADQISGVDAMVDTATSAIDQFSSATAQAFTDAIFGAQSFEESLAKLGESLAQMIMQMLIAQALQQAIGAGIQGALGPGAAAGSPGAGAQYGAFDTTTSGGVMLAKGGAVKTGIEPGIYASPKYFEMRDPGFHPMAKGLGLLGEAGPEAVLPLRKTEDGSLGVEASDDSGTPRILPVARLSSGNLGIRTDFATGGAPKTELPAGVYRRPTYFELDDSVGSRRFETGDILPHSTRKISATVRGLSEAPKDVAASDLPDSAISSHATREHPIRMMAEGDLIAGGSAKAILPLRPSKSGPLGVEAEDTRGRRNVLPLGSLPHGGIGPLARFAKGGVVHGSVPASSIVRHDTPLAPGIYHRPTFFGVSEPGLHAMATGGFLSSGAGRKEPMPLSQSGRDQSTSGSDGGNNTQVNVVVNNSSGARVSTESRDNDKGGKDIIITVADEVEKMMAARTMRTGTRMNRAIPTVGSVVAR